MNSKYILYFLFFFIGSLTAQLTPEQLLRQVKMLPNENSRKDKVKEVTDSLRKTKNYVLALRFIKLVENWSIESKDTTILVFAKNMEGNIFNTVGKYTDAITTFNELVAILLKSQHKKTNRNLLANVYMNLGNSFYFLGNIKRSQLYYKKSLALLKKEPTSSDDNQRLSLLYNNLGISYVESKNYLAGELYFKQALEIHKSRQDTIRINNVILNLANLSLYLQQYDTALKLTERARLGYLQQNYTDDVAFCDFLIAKIYLKKNDLINATKYTNKCLQNFDTTEYTVQSLGVYKTFYDLFYRRKEYERALYFYRKFSEVADSVNTQQAASDIEKKEMIAEINNMRLVDSLTNSYELKARDITIGNKKRQNYYLMFFLVLFLILSFYLYNRYQLINKQKKIIEIKEKETLAQNQIIAKQKETVEHKQKEIVDSINYAYRIQNALLSSSEIIARYIPNYFMLFKPKDIVSGDFYWSAIRDNHLYIAICDSTGHGVPGAFMSLINISFMNEAINEKNITEPGKVFDYVREKLIRFLNKEGQQDGFDGVLLKLNLETAQLTYAAAYNAPVLIRNKEAIALECDKMPVGKGEKEQYFRTLSVITQPGDMLYLFTDGYADQFGGPKGKKFMYKRLLQLLIELSVFKANEQQEHLTQNLNEWKGDLEQVDDICVLGISFS